ncbi:MULTISPECIES: magnesium transporter CorA family protein [unclassified Agarivorans]|uniref:magnesium transporter CorA family protein n=1 Tax=unclassified Agarivorans TaxID=2636026 RepID=UPI003D7ED130
MIRTWLSNKQLSAHPGDESQITCWSADPDSYIWIDIDLAHSKQVEAAMLLEQFQCHPLTIVDAFRERHPPKIEVFDDQIFMIYRGIEQILGELKFAHMQLVILVGKNYLITLHKGRSQGIESLLKDSFSKDLLAPLNLACRIMHTASGLYLNQLLEFETQLSEVEEQISVHGDDQLLADITRKKANIVRLSRVFNYHLSLSSKLLHLCQQNAFQQIAVDPPVIQDLQDRFERLHSLNQMYYNICGDLVDGYLSISSHKLNNTMRMLTLITAIFVPLSFLAGIYGMNFEFIPELHYRNAYFILLGTMLSIALSLIAIFKWKKWF